MIYTDINEHEYVVVRVHRFQLHSYNPESASAHNIFQTNILQFYSESFIHSDAIHYVLLPAKTVDILSAERVTRTLGYGCTNYVAALGQLERMLFVYSQLLWHYSKGKNVITCCSSCCAHGHMVQTDMTEGTN